MPRVYSASPSNGAIRQGEILSGLTEQRAVGPASNEDEAAPIDFVRHPFAVVLTQDCDLDSDFNTRREPGTNPLHKLLPNILFAEVFLARELRGQHNHLTSNLWRRVRKNEEQRYHYLPRVEPKDDALGEGSADDLTIDFKQVFTFGAEALYACIGTTADRRCCLNGPFMQDLSNRFGYYQIRVALPETETQTAPPKPS